MPLFTWTEELIIRMPLFTWTEELILRMLLFKWIIVIYCQLLSPSYISNTLNIVVYQYNEVHATAS
jgi:hypothetical protein